VYASFQNNMVFIRINGVVSRTALAGRSHRREDPIDLTDGGDVPGPGRGRFDLMGAMWAVTGRIARRLRDNVRLKRVRACMPAHHLVRMDGARRADGQTTI